MPRSCIPWRPPPPTHPTPTPTPPHPSPTPRYRSNYAAAEGWYRECLQLSPRAPATLVALAFCHQLNGRPMAAVETYHAVSGDGRGVYDAERDVRAGGWCSTSAHSLLSS